MRSYRFILALALGIAAMSANAQTEPVTTTATEDPATTTDAKATPTLAEAGTAVQQIAAAATTTDPKPLGDGEVLDAAAGAVDTLNGDTKDPTLTGENLKAASGIVNEVAGADLGAQPVAAPGTADVSDAAETAQNVAASADSLGTGGLANLASQSGNPGLSIAGQIGKQLLNSGLIDTQTMQKASAANPDLAALVKGLKNGAEIANGMGACYASIEGQNVEIQSAATGLGTAMVNTDTISGAAALGASMISAYAGSEPAADQEAMYQLFRIYLDQQANTGKALSTTQEKAYEQLTPQCNSAFEDIVQTYQDSRGTVTSLMAGGNTNVTCSNYQKAEDKVDMTLCVWPSAVWGDKDKIWANVTATFTNYGEQLCDISFYIINIDGAKALKPVWLPNANKAYPNGLPKGTEVAIEAMVPWTNDIAQDKPIVDILKGWTVCPNGKNAPLPTAKPTARATDESSSGVLGTAQDCFLNSKCQQAVAPYVNDACAAYNQLITSGCSTCSADILKGAQASCLQSCAATYCGTTADKQTTSGAGALSRAFAFVATLAMGAAAVFAF